MNKLGNLYLNSRKIDSIFLLLGRKENNISYSVAYSLANCKVFLRNFMLSIGFRTLNDLELSNVKILLQNHELEPGVTDIEILLEGQFHIIVEAKRGWTFPSIEQILKYAGRSVIQSKSEFRKILVFNESTPEFAEAHFSHSSAAGIDVEVISWKKIKSIVSNSKSIGRDFENRLLKELEVYLEKISTMQKKHSNRVYVVSLGGKIPPGWGLSFIDVVQRYNKYFHPVGGKKGGWPVEPPNYIAFRYYGQLQSIHHIDSYEVFRDPNLHIAEIPSSSDWELHYLYHLGPAIRPPHEIKAGAKIVRSMRVWAELDLLLTSNTIQEARDLSQMR